MYKITVCIIKLVTIDLPISTIIATFSEDLDISFFAPKT